MSIMDEIQLNKVNYKAKKEINYDKLYKILESDNLEANIEQGNITLEDINENPNEIDTVLSEYEIIYPIKNLLNAIKTSFGVDLKFNLNEDSSEVITVDVMCDDLKTLSIILDHFGEYSAGTDCNVEHYFDDSNEFIKISLVNVAED